MNAFEIYKSRLKAYGDNLEESYINTTKQSINNAFSQSPFSKTVIINEIEYEAIIDQGKDSNEKKILFIPDVIFNKGIIVNYSSKDYLIIDFEDNEMYPSGIMRLCNSTYKLKGEPTQTIVGYDYRQAPIYETVEGIPTLIPCIAENKIYTNDNNQAINLPDNQIKVTIPYTVHEDIAINKEFTMFDTVYKIIAVDKTQSIDNVGLMVITGQFEQGVSS